MGDAGEGLIDAEARIQERMEEVARQRAEKKAVSGPQNTKALQELESLRLARAEMQRQFDATTHDGRRAGLKQALAEIDSKVAALESSLRR
jgi:hypothetical protein